LHELVDQASVSPGAISVGRAVHDAGDSIVAVYCRPEYGRSLRRFIANGVSRTTR
jgi:hypothetical protein